MSTERIVGIDLGTTNSLVAYMAGDRPVVIPGGDGSNLVPSVVALDENGQIVVGNPAQKYLIETADHAVYSVKRLMGRGVEDIRDELKLFPFRLADDLAPGEVLRIKLGDKTFTPPEISAFILRQLKRNAERYFSAPVTQAVVTVPAYFNDAQRQATKDAGRIAGLDVLRLVNEPTAAALAYGLDKKETRRLRFTTWGAALSISRFSSCTKASSRSSQPTAIPTSAATTSTTCWSRLRSTTFKAISASMSGATLRSCKRFDKPLSTQRLHYRQKTIRRLRLRFPGGKHYQREITRAQFEQLIQPVIDRTVGPVRQAMKDAGLTPNQIDEAVLVGGSTRIPRVRQLVEELFQRKPHCDLNPDEVVALGAAVQANILAGRSEATKEMLLLDVTPLSLGIEALGGVVAKIIHRNSTIPASATEHFTTGVEGQTNVAIHVLQGERELAKDCRSLARFDLKGIPPMPAGLPRIEVKFLIDANGIMHVSARELRSGKEAEIEVQPSYGLTDEQVENMILDSFDNAEDDFRQRQVIEARNEAEIMLGALEKGRGNPVWERLSSQERVSIDKLETALRAVMKEDDYRAIRTAIDALNQGTMRLAELMMDSAVGAALKGKTMDTADVGEGPAAPHPIAQAEIE